MKILVTGAAGYIGSNLCEYLLAQNHEVIGVDNFNDYYSPKIKEFNVSTFENNPKFKLYRIDITDRKELEVLFKSEQIDSIVHLAAWAGVTPSVKHPHIYAEANYVGTSNLAEYATLNNVKNFVFASTSSVYGNNNKTPFKEDMDTSLPAAPYPASKKGAEVLLYAFTLNSDLNVTILRFFNPLGPRSRPDAALPKLIRAALYGTEFGLYQNPAASSRDYTYIGDMVKAIEAAAVTPHKYEIINLGNSNPVTLIDMLESVKRVTGKDIKTFEEPKPGQMEMTFADITKAKELLGYNPSTNLDEMVKIYYDWFIQQPDWYRRGEY